MFSSSSPRRVMISAAGFLSVGIAFLVSAAPAHAQKWRNPIAHTPLDPREYGRIFSPRSSGPSVSHTYALTPPSIDNQGNVLSGSSQGGFRGQIVGRAQLVYQQNQAFWTSDYQNGYGRVANSPLRAPGYDRAVTTIATNPVPNGPAVPPINAPVMQRMQWNYNGGTFSSNGNGQWMERTSSGDTFYFREMSRNNDWVHLQDDGRNIGILLWSDKCELSAPGVDWQVHSYGSFSR